jgi:hypothetical protein
MGGAGSHVAENPAKPGVGQHANLLKSAAVGRKGSENQMPALAAREAENWTPRQGEVLEAEFI